MLASMLVNVAFWIWLSSHHPQDPKVLDLGLKFIPFVGIAAFFAAIAAARVVASRRPDAPSLSGVVVLSLLLNGVLSVACAVILGVLQFLGSFHPVP
jgi:hypothetical protein